MFNVTFLSFQGLSISKISIQDSQETLILKRRNCLKLVAHKVIFITWKENWQSWTSTAMCDKGNHDNALSFNWEGNGI